jgi:periplasmic protein TonB
MNIMKKQLLTLLLLLTLSPIFSQSPLSVVTAPLEYDAAEVKPECPGGNESFTKYFVRSFQMPEVEGLAGEIKVRMVIGTDGKIGDIKVLRDLGEGTGKEAIRVLQSSPKWKPGMIGGKPVAVVYEFTITIRTD